MSSGAFSKFIQSMLFGGTFDDLAFELRVLKQETHRLHERLDSELDTLRDRLDKLEGKPGKGRGRSRLSIIGGPELADIQADPKLDAAPASARAEPAAPDPAPAAGPFTAGMTIAEAHASHPGAAEVFARHHLPGCGSCAVSGFETVGEGGRDHGLDVQALVDDLNRLVAV